MTQSAAAVTTRALTRDYGNGAGLRGVDLDVPRNAVYGLVGKNGAGKTTLLSILAGLRTADSGEIRLNVADGRVAMCPDAPAFEPWLTASEVVRQSLGLVAARRRHDTAAIVRPGGAITVQSAIAVQSAAAQPGAVDRVLAEVGLADVAKRRVGGFSRGMTQRLGLAVALILDPELLILDEPASALDPTGRAELLALIARLAGERTVVFSSHILADVERVADHIGVLDHGRLLFQGPTPDLIDAYVRPTWEIRVRGPIDALADALRTSSAFAAVDVRSDSVLTVEAVSAEAGETALPAVLASAGVRLIGVTPMDADLESAFLALTAEAGDAADASQVERVGAV